MKNRSSVHRILVLSVAASLGAGCYGPNKLGTDIYKWNMGLSDEKWPREIVFGGLYLTGVYPITALIDLLILNSIEFWSSDNPPTAGQASYGGQRKPFHDGSYRVEIERLVAGEGRVRVRVFQEEGLMADSLLPTTNDGTRRMEVEGLAGEEAFAFDPDSQGRFPTRERDAMR